MSAAKWILCWPQWKERRRALLLTYNRLSWSHQPPFPNEYHHPPGGGVGGTTQSFSFGGTYQLKHCLLLEGFPYQHPPIRLILFWPPPSPTCTPLVECLSLCMEVAGFLSPYLQHGIPEGWNHVLSISKPHSHQGSAWTSKKTQRGWVCLCYPSSWFPVCGPRMIHHMVTNYHCTLLSQSCLLQVWGSLPALGPWTWV